MYNPPSQHRSRRFIYIIAALLAVALLGFAVYFQSYLRASLLVDRPFSGPMWSTLVRHSAEHNGQTIYCYDEGSQFCERILARVTGNNALTFDRQRTLGYVFSPRLDLGSTGTQTLYSCVNLKDASNSTYTYRITTDKNVCNSIKGYPYPLGQIFTNPGDVEIPLPLYQQIALLSTSSEETNPGDEARIGYVAGTQINQIIKKEVVEVKGPDLTSLCTIAKEQCGTEGSTPLCAPAAALCEIQQKQPWQKYDVNSDNCVGEQDIAAVRETVGTDKKNPYDVNNDGEINILDVITITQFVDDPANAAHVCTEGDPVDNQPLLGDVNGDGAVNAGDGNLILRAVAASKEDVDGPLTSEQWEIANLDRDEIITWADYRLLGGLITGALTPADFPLALGDVSGKGGLSSGDTSLIQRHILAEREGKNPEWLLSGKEKFLADIDGDNEITYSDVRLSGGLATGFLKLTDFPVRLGDIDGDGAFTAADTTLVRDNISSPSKASTLTTVQGFLADIDGGGNITAKDASLSVQLASGALTLKDLPLNDPKQPIPKPWQNPVNQYDVNADGKVDLKDAGIVRNAAPAAWKSLSGYKLPSDFSDSVTSEFFKKYGYVDADGNSEIDSHDLFVILDQLNGDKEMSFWQNPLNQYDVNADGKVDLKDADSVRTGIFALGSDGLLAGTLEVSFFNTYGYVDVVRGNKLNIEDLEAILDQLNGAQEFTSFWQNPVNQYDVNADGAVSPVDVLQVINALNAGKQGSLPEPTGGNTPPPYLDVNGDGQLTEADKDAVTAHLGG